MPKKQKRFSSEKAILKALEAMEVKIAAYSALAEEREAHLKLQTTGDYKDYVRKQAWMARRALQRAETQKVKLGTALAKFRTMLLPMSNNEDNSVVL